MEQVPQQQALTKAEFHSRLRDWFTQTKELKIGPDSVDGRTRWIHVRSVDSLFVLHADAHRKSVEWYLGLVAKHGDELAWEPAASLRGKLTAVVYGPEKLRNPSFYLYVAERISAIFINGMFEETLTGILAAQSALPNSPFFLQPYAAKKIKQLADSNPSAAAPVKLYLSLSSAPGFVAFRANIVGWQDKNLISNDEVAELNRWIQMHQPSEKEIYRHVKQGQTCANLLQITDLERLDPVIPVSWLTKQSDQLPLKPRTTSGGWAYVLELPHWLGRVDTALETRIEQTFRREVARSLTDSEEARNQRLANAPKVPKQVQVVGLRFVRNADVVAAVLLRANGRCERCGANSPFFRASDGQPYLEVHHKKMLSIGGEDTVGNALATCPNCHRELHYGTRSDQS